MNYGMLICHKFGGKLCSEYPTRMEKHSTHMVTSVIGPLLGIRWGWWRRLELSSEYRQASGTSSSISIYSSSKIFLVSFAGREADWEVDTCVNRGSWETNEVEGNDVTTVLPGGFGKLFMSPGWLAPREEIGDGNEDDGAVMLTREKVGTWRNVEFGNSCKVYFDGRVR